MSPEASARAKKILTEGDVTIFNSAHVQSYDGFYLTIDNGKTIKTRTVLWAAGVKGEMPAGVAPEAIAKGNRIYVDEINRVKGYQNVFAIGLAICLGKCKSHRIKYRFGSLAVLTENSFFRPEPSTDPLRKFDLNAHSRARELMSRKGRQCKLEP